MKKRDKTNMTITKSNTISRIYYSHSKPDYNTEYELLNMNQIKEKYPDAEILNPKEIVISDIDKEQLSGKYHLFLQMMSKYYYPLIDKSDLVIASKSKTGKYSSGVKLEIQYATLIGIPVIDLEIPYPEVNKPTGTNI